MCAESLTTARDLSIFILSRPKRDTRTLSSTFGGSNEPSLSLTCSILTVLVYDDDSFGLTEEYFVTSIVYFRRFVAFP